MAVNRYDQAAPVQYVSQYVPIPFQELFAMTKYYGDEIKAARKELSDYAKSVGEFQSLLTKDVDSYHRIALNDNIQRVMNEAVANPNVMKSAAWRSSMASALNNVDYTSLSKLKKSAEQADLYDKLYKSLAAQGKMPPGWEPDYFGTYDTLEERKIFNATPLAYETMVDRMKPYFDNLKPSYLETKNGYDYFGIDDKTILRQIDAFKSDILSNPLNQRDMQRWIAAGATKEEAQNMLLRQAFTAGQEATYRTREINPFDKINAQVNAAARKAGLGGGNTPNGAVWFTQSMTADANIKHRKAAEKVVSQKPEYEGLRETIAAASMPNATKEQKEAGTKAEQQLKTMVESVTPAEALMSTFLKGTGGASESITYEQSVNGANNVINEYGAQIGSKYHDKLNGTIRGVSNKIQNTDVGKTYVVSGANNLKVATYAINTMVGVQYNDENAVFKVNEALRSGKFGELPIVGDGFVMGIPNGDNSNNYHGVSVAVSEQAVKNAKLDEAMMEAAGASVAYTRRSESTSETERPRVDWDGDAQYLTTTTTHVRGGEKYYILPTMHDLPSTGGGIAAETLNNLVAEEQYSDAQRGNLQTFNFLLSNL